MSTMPSQMTEAQRAAKQVRDRNYRFRKMPRNRQRMAIARDVIKFLDERKIIATRGTYFEFTSRSPANKASDETQLKEFLQIPTVKCEVCAIGSVFAAAVMGRGVNGQRTVLTSDPWGYRRLDCPSRPYMVSELRPYFSAREMTELEEYFENTSEFEGLDDDEALRSAMEHIIATNGEEVCP